MSMFRAKKLDLGCFVNIKTIRDHSKRKAFEAFETQRCVSFTLFLPQDKLESWEILGCWAGS